MPLDHAEFAVWQGKKDSSVMSSTGGRKSQRGIEDQKRPSNLRDHYSLHREGAPQLNLWDGYGSGGREPGGETQHAKAQGKEVPSVFAGETVGKLEQSWKGVYGVWQTTWKHQFSQRELFFCRVRGRDEGFWTFTTIFPAKQVTQRIHLLYKDDVAGCILRVMNVMFLMGHIY